MPENAEQPMQRPAQPETAPAGAAANTAIKMPTSQEAQPSQPGANLAEKIINLSTRTSQAERAGTERPQQQDSFRFPTDLREIAKMPIIRSQEQWQKMTTFDMGQAIEYGKITDPRAILTLANKELAAEQQKAKDETERAAIEARYKPLIEGDKQALANYCIDKAQPHLDYSRNRAEVDIAFHRAHPDQTMFNISDSIKAGADHYGVASHWYDLASQTTADKEATIKPQSEAEAKQIMEASRITTEQQNTLSYLRDHPTQLGAVTRLQNQSSEDMHELIATLQEMKAKELTEKTSKEQGAASQILIDLILALIPDQKAIEEAAKKTIRAELATAA